MTAHAIDATATHHDARDLTLKLLALAQRMEERDARVIALLVEQGARLEAGARDLHGMGQRVASDALHMLRTHAHEVVQAGVGDAAAGYRERLAALAGDAGRASAELRASAQALRRQRRLWGWAAPLALLAGSVLAVGAAAYAVAHAREQVERHRIEAALLRAYNAADVTLCGERLCANVDPRGPAVGPGGRYRAVRARAAPSAP
ncbi:hypothetical protein [Lysobacter humi (ex Lee et al. 2017)]